MFTTPSTLLFWRRGRRVRRVGDVRVRVEAADVLHRAALEAAPLQARQHPARRLVVEAAAQSQAQKVIRHPLLGPVPGRLEPLIRVHLLDQQQPARTQAIADRHQQAVAIVDRYPVEHVVEGHQVVAARDGVDQAGDHQHPRVLEHGQRLAQVGLDGGDRRGARLDRQHGQDPVAGPHIEDVTAGLDVAQGPQVRAGEEAARHMDPGRAGSPHEGAADRVEGGDPPELLPGHRGGAAG